MSLSTFGALGTSPAHFVNIGGSAPGWGQTQRWGLVGQSPSTSIYDQLYPLSDVNTENQIRGGTHTGKQQLPLSAPTMTRHGRVGAQFNSSAAARYFQGYTGSGTGHNWSAKAMPSVPRQLHQSFNPNMQGAAELHPATTYDPFPAPGSLFPKVV